jgi:hypothetical protein
MGLYWLFHFHGLREDGSPDIGYTWVPEGPNDKRTTSSISEAIRHGDNSTPFPTDDELDMAGFYFLGGLHNSGEKDKQGDFIYRFYNYEYADKANPWKRPFSETSNDPSLSRSKKGVQALIVAGNEAEAYKQRFPATMAKGVAEYFIMAGILKAFGELANATELGLDSQRYNKLRVLDEVPPEEIPETGPGSAAHKADRWSEYQKRGGAWTFERWSKTYEINMQQARKANVAVDAYHKQLGWGTREVTIDVEGMPRRLDIADRAAMRGIEYKTGYQTFNAANRWEIARDQVLTEQGWNIKWVFEGKASKPLLEALKDAKIPVEFK